MHSQENIPKAVGPRRSNRIHSVSQAYRQALKASPVCWDQPPVEARLVQVRDLADYSVVEHRAARRVEHQRVTVAVAHLPDTRAVQEAVHRLAMAAGKADRQRVMVAAVHLLDTGVAGKADRQQAIAVAVVAVVHLQDTVAAAKVDLRQVIAVAVVAVVHLQDTVVEGRARVAVELAQAVPVPEVPVPVVAERARED